MADEAEKGTKVITAAELVVVLTTPPTDPENNHVDAKSTTNNDSSSDADDSNKVQATAALPATQSSPCVIGSSFRELECLKITHLPENEKKALVEFKQLIQDALKNHQLTSSSTPPPPPLPHPVQSCPATPPPPQKPAEYEEDKPVSQVSIPESKPLPLPEEYEMKKNEDPESGVDEKNGTDPPPASAEPQVKEMIPKETVIVAADDAQEKVADHKDDDETRTVEAIKETIISVVSESSSPTPLPPKDEEQKKQATAEQLCSLPSPVAAQGGGGGGEEKVSIYGIPLLQDERTDVILWKFLRARDFKVKEAFNMLRNTLEWREEFKIDELIENQGGGCDDVLGERVVFMHGVSKEGHPVCYNVYGAFQDRELYSNTFSDEEKRQSFLKWRILFLEKSIRKMFVDLESTPGSGAGAGAGITSFVQVNDLKNSPGPSKWELRQATKQALHLLQDNYPEFVAKQVFINVPWWYMAVHKMISPFLTQRTKSKFVFAGPSKSPETLFNYILPEQVPVQYGGLSRRDGEFSANDVATQIIIKPSSKETVEFSANEECQLSWELRVLGWDVSYGAEFVPYAKDAYTVIIQKIHKVGPADETVISTHGFKVTEPGKIVLTVDNATSKKKRLVYRLKSNPASFE